MRLEDDELVFYDFEWLVDNNVVSHDKQYVSPFFGLDISPHIREAKSFRFGIRLKNVIYDTKAVVFLYVHHLDSLGIGVTDVECFIDKETVKLCPTFRDAQTLIFESKEIWAADCLLDYKFSLKYRIYPTNSHYGYTMDRGQSTPTQPMRAAVISPILLKIGEWIKRGDKNNPPKS